jgi:hypothetical protein
MEGLDLSGSGYDGCSLDGDFYNIGLFTISRAG